MFMQVMEGRLRDVDGFRGHVDRWATDLAPGADGWLGTTAGTTEDGTFVALVRFESEEAARANSERPEQGAWWEEASKSFDGDVAFTNCPEVDTFGGGGSDSAGFVQIMTGRADREEVRPLAEDLEEALRRMRPDVIGGAVAWPGDGTFIQAVYFTSEDDARKGETAEPSEEDRAAMERLGGAMSVERYLDLREPWLESR